MVAVLFSAYVRALAHPNRPAMRHTLDHDAPRLALDDAPPPPRRSMV